MPPVVSVSIADVLFVALQPLALVYLRL